MGFGRRGKAERLDWKRWLARDRAILVECGLPSEIWEDPDHWRYFLDQPSLSTRTRSHWFRLDLLSPTQMRRPCAFLQSEFKGEPADPYLLQVLHGELGLPQRWQCPDRYN
jgi:hypothetical protein